MLFRSVTTHGKKLTAYTWKSNLLSWWNHKTPLERASIESEYKDAMKSAAELTFLVLQPSGDTKH